MSKRPNRPPPNDGYKYIWVDTKESGHWRKVRGSIKEARLNKSFKKNAKLASITSPAAKQILLRLAPFVKGMETGRFIARVGGRLKKALNKSGCFHFGFMDGYELQPHRPLYDLFPLAPNAKVVKNEVVYTIELAHSPVKKHAKFITGYFFELIMLTGDPSQPRKLRVESETSPIYNFKSKLTGTCEMRLLLPNGKIPWMVFLKVCCVEGDEPVMEAVHSGMKVIKANPIAFVK